MLYTQTGTPYYASPEIWKDKPYDAKSDMWSLGCVLYEAAAQHPPFRAADMQGLFKKVVAGVYPDLPKSYSSEFAEVIKQLLQLNSLKRPTCRKRGVTSLLEQILDRQGMAKKIKDVGVISYADKVLAEGEILGTIMLPKNIISLSSRLPKPNYKPCPQFQKY